MSKKNPSPFWNKKHFKYFTVKSVIGLVLGMIGGYIYYIKIGCNSGSCPITSNPWLTVVWGAAVGYLAGGIIEWPVDEE